MKTKIFLLFLALGMGTMQMEAQGLFKQLKKAAKEIKQEKKGQEEESLETLFGEESSTSSKKSSPKTSQSPSESSSEDEVTLVVSADGATKDEATKVALRSAIEQAYGTFVSANTTILNDELVKDEIVTVTSGNIKHYSEISSNVMPDGKTFVTLQATVCISKLVSYAQSKGAETEFAGATFGMNMKMKELNKQNEIKAWQNLKDQIIEMYKSAFTYQLEVDGPKLIDDRLEVEFNNYRFRFGKDEWQKIGLPGNPTDYYAVIFKVKIVPTQMMESIVELIANTANSLALTGDEYEEYKELNIPTSGYGQNQVIHGKVISPNYGYDCYFRSDIPYIEINNEIMKILCNFEIVDNVGNASYFKSWKYGEIRDPYFQQILGVYIDTGCNFCATAVQMISDSYLSYLGKSNYLLWDNRKGAYMFNLFDEEETLIEIPTLIHKNDLNKYSKFEIRERMSPILINDPKNLMKKLMESGGRSIY